MQQLVSRTLRQQEAAQQLGLSVRQVRRLLVLYRLFRKGPFESPLCTST
ncbi:hypothetical protein HFU84_13825 [Acidithiobacillus sp. CV18-2]|uniref:Uncharacterized protein n=1 Tax=Igneacidithiobacillus copahuensis TaxID=2724909 RepID=A0AAE3CKY6_9PROT|nr:hypothetical protein [Acidithiobacillus sp. CV18-3]MBU2778552.1 hypothetical protein [Acidithiobacillus sp. CV18-2]MBU2789259.1 hypothetical protein [Igneacidithiobacillus copahuensis]MBU2798166.1 hypothetical protein [Acidithiobacillus sp. VAN18-4]